MNPHDRSYRNSIKERLDDSGLNCIEAALFACSLLGVLGFILLVLPS